MKKIIIPAALLLIFSLSAFSQVTFQKTYEGAINEKASYVKRTSDGGYIVAGYTNSYGTGDYDVYLIKTDSDGNLTWSKTYGGSGWDIGKFVQQTFDGGYIVGGETRSFSTGGNRQIYLVKTGAAGGVLWSRTFGGTYEAYLNSVFQTQDGGYIIGGKYNLDALVIKTDGNGNIIWTKTFGDRSGATCAKQTSNGEYFIVGYSQWFNPAVCDGSYVRMLKLDAGGNLLWKKKITCGWAQSFFQTPDGGFMILGNVGSILPSSIHLMKTDSAGNLAWAKSYGVITQASDFVQTDDNGYVILGAYSGYGNFYAFKTDSAGNVSWSNIYGLNGNSAYSVDKIPGDGFIFAGGIYDSDSSDVYLIKTDVSGYSGCNQNSVSTNVTNLSLQVSIDTLTESSNDTTNTVVTSVGIGGGVSDTICYAIGMEELNNAAEIFLYPNPASNELRIKNVELKIEEVGIYDVLGQRVFSQKPTANSQQLIINVSTLPNGIYFLQLKSKAETRIQKFIISR